MRFKLEGIVAAMVTPFTKNGDYVDFDRIGGVAEGVLRLGAHGLFVCGTTGEGMLMTAEERKAVLEEVVASVGSSKAKIIAHTGAIDTATTVELTVHAAESGADASAVVAPPFYPFDDKAIEQHFSAVASAAEGHPVFLYNIPGFARNRIALDSVLRLAEKHDNIVGIKDSSGDMVYLGKLLAAAPAKFVVMNGCDEFGHQALAAGASGAVSGTANAFGDLYVKLFDAARKNDHAKARKLQHDLNRVCGVLTYGGTLAMFKAAMKLRGIDAGYVRPPQREITAAEIKPIAALIESLGLRKR